MRSRRKIIGGVVSAIILTAISVPAFGAELLTDNNIKAGCIKAGVASVIVDMDDILSENSVSMNAVEDIAISNQSIVFDTERVEADDVKDISMNDVLKLAMIAEGRVTITDEEKHKFDLTGDCDITMADVVKASIVASKVN